MAVSGRKAPKTFSSTLSTGSGEDFELFCQPCDLADLRLPAFGFCCDCEEHLCESCFNHHQRSKPSRHHKLLDKNNMPQTQQVQSKSAHTVQSDDLTEPCPKHKKEIIKFYCHDHEKLLCSVCVTLQHTGSCKVSYIPDISEDILDGKEYKDIVKEIEMITEKCHKIKSELNRMITKSNTSLTDVLAEIKKLRQKINQKLDTIEKAAVHAVKVIQLDNVACLKTAETSCENAVKSMNTSSDSMKQLHASKQADKLFLELQHAKQLVTNNNNIIDCLKSPKDVKEYYFVPMNTISILMENEKFLGTLATKTFKQSSTPPAVAINQAKPSVPRSQAAGESQSELPTRRLVAPPWAPRNRSSPSSAGQSRAMTKAYQPPSTMKTSLQPSHFADISVKSHEDKKQCRITGMALLTPSKLVLTDSENFSIKLLDLKSNSIVHQLHLTLYYPWDIAAICNDSTVITMPGRQIIQFVSATSNMLSFKNSFKTDGECRGICHYENKLVVSFWIPVKLQILDLHGTVLQKVETGIFVSPSYVQANRDFICVSDNVMQALIMLSWEGEQIRCCKEMGSPQGIALLEDGSIFVGDPQKGKRTIENISRDFKQRNIILRDLQKPLAISWCSTNRKLYISYHSDNRLSMDNFIQIYKMSG